MSQTYEEKSCAKILLKNVENFNDNFEMVSIVCE